jgi:hypothetical protein
VNVSDEETSHRDLYLHLLLHAARCLEDNLADARSFHLHQSDYTVGVDLEWRGWLGVEVVVETVCSVSQQVAQSFHWDDNLEAAVQCWCSLA